MEMKDEKKAKQIAEERMAIIAPLLNPGLDTAEIRRIRQQIAENGGPSERTVDRYLKHYLQDGFNGLMPEGKNPNAVPPEAWPPLFRFWRWKAKRRKGS